ncbi:Piso0_002193 [Millerozyma farinosa CBS 7064]|uniref:Piso0_002193 protein n=1 Tax=Pichia sorbitophila (strain ATCC MYA-4447 / BCRC 22081 / CBS 7064 / NBRC 10061 / NRRL Y-12695) TaxID=559304 RepID=G8YED5_PICSO|nr:Piso0_002193 [Millerozyma farinosa CBS 7064]
MQNSNSHSGIVPPAGGGTTNGKDKSAQWQNQRCLQQQLQSNQKPPLANYTLPGVINYLTSEFTDLERYKIMTNIEKSEMKYKILSLQGENNSLKILNEKYKSKIKQLEKQVSQLSTSSNSGSNEREGGSSSSTLKDMPEIDLNMINKSRGQLIGYIKEILQLLKPPSSVNDYVQFPEPGKPDEYEELINNPDADSFFFHNKEPNNESKREGLFAQYFGEKPLDAQDDNKPSIPDEPFLFEEYSQKKPSFDDEHSESGLPSATDESDTETIINDYTTGSAPLNEASESQNKSKDTSAKNPKDSTENKLLRKEASLKLDSVSDLNIMNEEYEKYKLFNNECDGSLVIVNYKNRLQDKKLSLTVFSSISNRIVTSLDVIDDIASSMEEIISIYYVPEDISKNSSYFLVVYAYGAVELVSVDSSSNAEKETILSLNDTTFNSTSLKVLSSDSAAGTISTLLVLTGLRGHALKPFINIWSIDLDKKKNVKKEDKGYFDKQSLKLCSLEKFRVLHIMSQTCKTSESKTSPQDISAIIDTGNDILKLQVESKHSYIIPRSGNVIGVHAVSFSGDHALLVEKNLNGKSSFVVFDLQENKRLSQSSDESNISLAKSPYIIATINDKNYIFKVADDSLSVHDSYYKFLKKFQLKLGDKSSILQSPSKILIFSESGGSPNLACYDLNALFI